MNLDPSETQMLLRETIRGFLKRSVPFDRVRALEAERDWDAELWQGVCEQGWVGLPVGEEHGGNAGSLIDVGIVVEEFARRAAIVPIAEVLTACWVIDRYGAETTKPSWIDGLLSGRVRFVPAAGNDLRVAGRRLQGEIAVVDYGHKATHHLVAATEEEGALAALFAVEARGPGVSCEPLVSIGRMPSCAVRYDGVAATRVCGGDVGVAALLRLGRTLAAVQCVGSMAEALDMTVRYARFREQFGKPIGSFQAVRHHCANMAMQIESARFLAYEALGAIDAGRATDAQVALAKASASRAVPEVTMLAHQIHGGNGVIEENDLYFFTLRGKEHSLAWGSADECLAIVAGAVEEPGEWL
jgi:alkylation response protein AidB-like acyl-CoA dehydrogenase